jgi:hypothetical protein
MYSIKGTNYWFVLACGLFYNIISISDYTAATHGRTAGRDLEASSHGQIKALSKHLPRGTATCLRLFTIYSISTIFHI